MSKVKFKILRGAHERKNTKLTIINILFVFFRLSIFLFMVSFEAFTAVCLDAIILVYNRLTLRLGIRYWTVKQTKVYIWRLVPLFQS